MTAVKQGDVVWTPHNSSRDCSRIGKYLQWLEAERGLSFPGYQELWEWSVTDLEQFWATIWDYFDVISSTPYDTVLSERTMPGARWFPGARINYAEHVLRGAARAAGDEPVMLARSQTRGPVDLTAQEIAEQVARARVGLQRLGVGLGDRVAAYLPNVPEAIIAFLACASLGAVWSSCPPEFGAQAAVDRLAQIQPKVLFVVDGYRYGEKEIDRLPAVQEIRDHLPSLEATVFLPYLQADQRPSGVTTWTEFMSEDGPLSFDRVPFDHPLYVLFSSGTTGLPKPIVHGHGGILLEHLKSHSFHQELGPGDTMFFFTTTGWMVWNWIVSALAAESRIVLFDGDPVSPDLGELWRVAGETRTTLYGGSAAFFTACRAADVRPRELADISTIRTVVSSGAPLPAECYQWIYDAVGTDVYLQSPSGGTDVCGAFVGGTVLLPVRAGEIACRCLGAKVQAFDSAGHSVVGEQGELVVTEPMPSMPVQLWNDPGGRRLRSEYYKDFPGVWRHGDWITLTEHGSAMINGRSDATLNRGGVRLGTSEFYAVVENLPEIQDSLVVHLEDASGGMGNLLLFVVLAPGALLDDSLQLRIAAQLRQALSPRHVPDAVHVIDEVPRTLTGKKLEVPVKRILTGTPVAVAASKGALQNPGSLAVFEDLAAARLRGTSEPTLEQQTAAAAV
ncbi:MAG: acetoacetate--CoA ligase [Propionibacteriales bacterium]|nr:acetoacetate--CoA ligase [Propionibacteriales bacterium]